MRGYVDGDGTIGCYEDNMLIEVLGTEEFLLGFYNQIKDTGLPLNKLGTHGKAKSIGWHGNVRYKLFSDFIYKDAHIYLDRKYYLGPCKIG